MLIPNQQEVNLGNIKYGETKEFTYKLSNAGDKEVKINKVIRGCSSCTEASVGSSVVEVGGYTMLFVKYTPGSTGVSRKQIHVIYSEDGVERETIVTFKAIIQ
jgi:hypothetical protein